MKIVGIILAILAIILVGFGVDAYVSESQAVAIIGGADGPTSIFVAGKIGDTISLVSIVLLVAAICIVTALIWYFTKRRK